MNPFCPTQGCFAPVAVAHAHMDYNSTFYAGGSMVTYTCNPTYELVGPPSITCIQDPAKSVYVWTPGPNCLRKVYECGPLPKITNGKHSDTYNRTVNSTVAYTCDRDFKLIGQETVACVLAINQSTATWTERPSCIPGTLGRQFVFGIPDIYLGRPEYIKMYISSTYASTVFINAPGIGFNQNITTLANTTTAVTIPDSIIATSAGLSNKAVYVATDKPVSAYVMVRNATTSDGFLLLPITAGANEFVVPSYDTVEGSLSEFLVTALEDSQVEVRLRMSTGNITIGGQSYISGQNFSFVMNKLQTYLVQHQHDLTGTHITSSKPVSVVSGNTCTNVPKDITACDFLAEQLLPVRFWQHTYLCANLKTRRNNRFRVLSLMDNNAVNIGGTQVSLNNGDFYEYVSSNDVATAVVSTHPVLVLQFAEGSYADNAIGDPSMITVPSTDNQESEYFYETPTSVSFHYASITIPTDHASGLRMDGNTISRSDEQITTINITMFSIIRVSVVAGKHHIYHVDSSVSFGVIVYGFDTDELYGFPLGLGRYVPTSIKRNKGSILPTTPYHIQTQFFIDPNFQQEIPGNPLSVKTVANVFVKTFVDNVDWKVKMRLHSCYAEQTLDGFNGSYNLINNGCEMDANTHLLSQTAHETRFVFQAFHISGLDQQLYINCDATICDTSDLMSSHQCDQRPDCAKQ
ncbi:IgGFc-binding protein-like isoform X2 [Dreissena polymorpha]|uniref:Sushi domain-containing protein n=1 Tax=Dreissena polymorpha TaxID=45954 RepID=A0A9D3YZ47_DREPO|nr:IgGFc-binding protein-like isoform X2 [Dreissena polymorpha]KAH3707695.1 hypothetical protein DPMN_067106 [Dreissena polymorpha]